jgi:hypothetical protein
MRMLCAYSHELQDWVTGISFAGDGTLRSENGVNSIPLHIKSGFTSNLPIAEIHA